MLRKRQDIKTHISFCSEKERKKEKLPQTFSLARDIQRIKQLREGKVIDIHLFCLLFVVGFRTKHENAKHEKDFKREI